MHFSKQRETIFQYLKETKEHPTAERIYADLKAHMPSLSLATVYRNCNRLAEEGALIRLDAGGKTHFDADTSDHQHFVCNTCGSVYDMFFSLPQEIIESNLPKGFEHQNHKLYFFGVCKHCK